MNVINLAASPVSFQTVTDDPIVKRTETVGRVQPHVKAKLIDTEGRIVPVGTPGEVCVSGYLLQKGYSDNFFFPSEANYSELRVM